MKLKGKAKKAFLRRMARGRNKRQGKKRHHHRKEHTTVKRKRRRTTTTPRRHRRRHHAGGGGNRYIPPTDTLIRWGASFAYGKVESAAQANQKHFIRSVPALVPQIGRAGNLGALLWLAGVLTKHKVVKTVADSVVTIAAYQNGRAPAGAFTKDGQDFKLSGPGGGGRRDEQLVEAYLRNR